MMATHRGTYRLNRLTSGIKLAPAEFNRTIDVPRTLKYFEHSWAWSRITLQYV